MAEQEKLIEDVAEHYRAAHRKSHDHGSIQGCQDSYSALPDKDLPCPQGVQG